MAFLDLHEYRTPANGLARMMSARRREALEAEIDLHLKRVDLLIARLDREDGDWDAELDDEDCGAEDHGEPEEWRYGCKFTAPLPAYGMDQSKGPGNGGAVHKAWLQHFKEAA